MSEHKEHQERQTHLAHEDIQIILENKSSKNAKAAKIKYMVVYEDAHEVVELHPPKVIDARIGSMHIHEVIGSSDCAECKSKIWLAKVLFLTHAGDSRWAVVHAHNAAGYNCNQYCYFELVPIASEMLARGERIVRERKARYAFAAWWCELKERMYLHGQTFEVAVSKLQPPPHEEAIAELRTMFAEHSSKHGPPSTLPDWMRPTDVLPEAAALPAFAGAVPAPTPAPAPAFASAASADAS